MTTTNFKLRGYMGELVGYDIEEMFFVVNAPSNLIFCLYIKEACIKNDIIQDKANKTDFSPQTQNNGFGIKPN